MGVYRSPKEFLVKRTATEEKAYEHNKRLMYERDNWHCRHCNTSFSLTPHHVVFQSQGGTDDLNNLLCLCIRCHNAVHDRLLLIEVIETLAMNLAVKFWKQKGWTL